MSVQVVTEEEYLERAVLKKMLCRDLSRKITVDNRQVFSLFENLVEDQ